MSKVLQKLKLTSLVVKGFKYQNAKTYLEVQRRSSKDVVEKAREILPLLPFDVKNDKMFEDVLTTQMVLTEFKDAFPEIYGLVLLKDKTKKIFRMKNRCEVGHNPYFGASDLVELLKEKGSVAVRSSMSSLYGLTKVAKYDGFTFSFGGEIKTEEEMLALFDGFKENTVIMENTENNYSFDVEGFEEPRLHVVNIRDGASGELFTEVYVAEHGKQKDVTCQFAQKMVPLVNVPEELKNAVSVARIISNKFQDFEYLNIRFAITDDAFKVEQIDTGLDLIFAPSFTESVKKVLRTAKERARMEQGFSFARLWKYVFSIVAKRKGFVDFMYKNWLNGWLDDMLHTDTSLRDKLWAWKRGFYSYRIEQYSLTEENYKDVLSDYDYKRLRPLNNGYFKWFWNKSITGYILEPYEDYFPQYYYRLNPGVGEEYEMVPFKVTEEDVKVEFCELLDLLTQKKKLALKPVVSSHGIGFHVLEKTSESILMDGELISETELKTFLEELDKTYIISEYIEMHHELKRIYDKAACTIRVMTINDGYANIVRDAYFRIGSEKSGYTDNVAMGGMVAAVDVETGHFGDAEMIANHKFYPTANHPDTGTFIDGVFPHWNFMKSKIEEICRYVAPLEYLGFDVVITEAGFKILEINTHQDLHRYIHYPDSVKAYFTRKKKLKFGTGRK